MYMYMYNVHVHVYCLSGFVCLCPLWKLNNQLFTVNQMFKTLKLRSIDMCNALDSPPLSRVRFGCGSEVGRHFQLLVPAPSQTRLREKRHRVHVHVHVYAYIYMY